MSAVAQPARTDCVSVACRVNMTMVLDRVFARRAGSDYLGLLSKTVILYGSNGSRYFPPLAGKAFS